MATPQPTYSFPILSNSEILACLRELDVRLDERDLLRPTHDALRAAYEDLLEILTGVDVATRSQIDEEALAKLENPEMFLDAIPNLAFIRAMQELAKGVGIDDFGLKDIFKPEYGRTRRNLSAIINFAKFREERLIEYENELAEQEEIERSLAEAMEENARLKAQLAEREAAARDSNPEEEARILAGLEEEIAALKLKDAQQDAELAASEEELRASLAEEEALRQELEALEAAHASQMGEEEAQREREAQQEEENQRNLKETQEKMEEMQTIEANLKEAIALMQEMEADFKTKEEAEAKLRAMQAEMVEKEEEIWKLDAKIEQLQRQQQSMDEKLTRLKSQGKLKEEAALAALKAAKDELAAAEARVGSQRAKEEENKKQLAIIEEKTKTLVENHNRDMDALVRKYHELRDVVRDYHEKLFEAMEESSIRAAKSEREMAHSTPNSMLSTPSSPMFT